MIIQNGFYQHFKGEIYSVIGTAQHTETEENFVIYTNHNQLFARPLYMFTEYVDGKPRFRKINLTKEN